MRMMKQSQDILQKKVERVNHAGVKKHQLLILTLVSSVFLTGCQFYGIWPQSYDGIPINNNPEGNALFHETGELTNYNQEMRYPYMESTEILLAPDVDNSITEAEVEDMEVITFEPGEYIVGEDIDPGIYISFMDFVDGTEAAAIIVTDNDDVQILEINLEGQAHLYLNEGYTVEVVSSRNEVMFRPMIEEIDRITNDGGFVMQGHHIIGDTLPSGTYSLESLELLLMRADGTPQVFVNTATNLVVPFSMGDLQTLSPEDYERLFGGNEDEEEQLLVELNDGDVVINERGLSMSLVE